MKRKTSHVLTRAMTMASRGSGMPYSKMALRMRVLMNSRPGPSEPTLSACSTLGGDRPEVAVVVPEYLAPDEPVERRVDDVLGAGGEALDPVLGGAPFGGVGDLAEHGVDQRVAGGRLVEEVERVDVGVDASLEGELGEDGADDGAVQVPPGDLVEVAALLVEEHQDELFGQAQLVSRYAFRLERHLPCPCSPNPC